MSSKFLAIDIKHDLLTAIVFTVDAKAMHIIDQTMVTVADRPFEEALMELSQKIDCQETSCHIAFAADSFFYRNLLLPFTDTKTINKILPFELEENTPVKIDRLLIDAMIAREGKQKSQVIVAMIDRDLLATRLATLQALGIDPETVTISGIPTALRLTHTPDLPADFLLLTLDLQRATFILVRSGHISVIRPLIFDPGLQAGFHVDQDSKSIKVFRPENIENTFQTLCIAIQQTLQSVFNAHELAVYLSGPVGALPGTADHIQAGLGRICQSCTLVSGIPTAMDGLVSWAPGTQGMDVPVSLATGIAPAEERRAQEQPMAMDRLVPPFMPPQDEKWLSGIMEDSVNLGWQITKNWKGFNFRKEAFATRKSFTDSRTLAFAIVLPLISVVLLSILYLWVDYSKLLKKQNELNAQIHAVFTETLPEITRIVDPLQQLQVKIRETKSASMDKGTLPTMTILDILAEISANIPASLDIRLERFVVDDTGLRLKGTTDTFNTVDAIKKGLERSPAFNNIDISSANLDAKSSKIRFELKLTMKGV